MCAIIVMLTVGKNFINAANVVQGELVDYIWEVILNLNSYSPMT